MLDITGEFMDEQISLVILAHIDIINTLYISFWGAQSSWVERNAMYQVI